MKKRNLFITLGLALGLGVAATAGLAQGKEAVEVDATSSCTFKVDKNELSSWGGVGSWGLYAWYNETPIIDSFDNCYGNMTLSGDYYSITVNYSDGIDGAILLFKQNTQPWRSNDITIAGGFKADGTYVLSYGAWVNDNDGNGRKTFSANIEDASIAPTYSLVGMIGGVNHWEVDHDLVWNGDETIATLSNISLLKGDAVKIRKNHSWVVSYGWNFVKDNISVTDEWSEAREAGDTACFTYEESATDSANINVLHDGVYTFTYTKSTNTFSISGTRNENDSDVIAKIAISADGTSSYEEIDMELKQGSTTEYLITRNFTAGEVFYIRFGTRYYHYEHFKGGDTSLKGKQFVANGEDIKALYSANYTIYFETDTSSEQFGGWLQFNSVYAAQIADNLVRYAQYFNSTIKGVCDPQGKDTVISDLQSAWQSVYTRYNNAPADVKTAIAGATESYDDTDVKEFVAKYASVYRLRGAELGTYGGDFLGKNITPIPSHTFMPSVFDENSNSLNAFVIITIAAMALVTLGGVFLLRRKEN